MMGKRCRQRIGNFLRTVWLAVGLVSGLVAVHGQEDHWTDGVGEGLEPGAHSFSVLAGGQLGFAAIGGTQDHHLALASVSYGQVLGGVRCEGTVLAGSLELRGELFGGVEFSPEDEWLIGLTPHLRYNFMTRSRWMPFADLGAGVTATSIGPPDLSGTFEFNLKAGGGLHYFLTEDLALTGEVYCMHLSCARISEPNLGINGVVALIGATWYW